MLPQFMRLFECEFCDKMFSHKGNLNTHIGSIHDAKKSFVKNNVLKKSTLILHVTSVHDGKKPFESEFCDKSLSKKSSPTEYTYWFYS